MTYDSDCAPRTSGRVLSFGQATETMDIMCREQVASWLMYYERGGEQADAVLQYYAEVRNREPLSDPLTGNEIRAYAVGKCLDNLGKRSPAWESTMLYWLGLFTLHTDCSYSLDFSSRCNSGYIGVI